MIRCARSAALLAVLLIAGCTTLQREAPLPTAAREFGLLGMESWSLRGRIAVRDSEGEGGQAGVSWQQRGPGSYLDLAGPFGAGRVLLTFEPGRAAAMTADEERRMEYTGPDAAERFMADQLGWSFPVASARYWVLGLADPAAQADLQLDAAGLPATLRQHGWNIGFERFADVDGYAMPVKLRLENGRFRLRLVVSDWKLFESAG